MKHLKSILTFVILAIALVGVAPTAIAQNKSSKKTCVKKSKKTYTKKSKKNTQNDAVVLEDKDNPIFKMDDVTKVVQNGKFKVFLLKDGSVVCYNKATGQNTKINNSGAKDIGFRDTAAGILNIRLNDDTRKIVDLNTGKIVSTETVKPVTP